jgi:hypothetical protein
MHPNKSIGSTKLSISTEYPCNDNLQILTSFIILETNVTTYDFDEMMSKYPNKDDPNDHLLGLSNIVIKNVGRLCIAFLTLEDPREMIETRLVLDLINNKKYIFDVNDMYLMDIIRDIGLISGTQHGDTLNATE